MPFAFEETAQLISVMVLIAVILQTFFSEWLTPHAGALLALGIN